MHTLGSHRVYIHGIHKILIICLKVCYVLIVLQHSHCCKYNLQVTPFETND